MVAALLLTDIHLVKPESSPYDVDVELRSGLLRHLPRLLRTVGRFDLILVAGDVAFSGTEDQYAVAAGEVVP